MVFKCSLRVQILFGQSAPVWVTETTLGFFNMKIMQRSARVRLTFATRAKTHLNSQNERLNELIENNVKSKCANKNDASTSTTFETRNQSSWMSQLSSFGWLTRLCLQRLWKQKINSGENPTFFFGKTWCKNTKSLWCITQTEPVPLLHLALPTNTFPINTITEDSKFKPSVSIWLNVKHR